MNKDLTKTKHCPTLPSLTLNIPHPHLTKSAPKLCKLAHSCFMLNESNKFSGLIKVRTLLVVVGGQPNTLIAVLLPAASVSLGVCPIVQNGGQHGQQGQGSPSSKHTLAEGGTGQVMCPKCPSVLCVVCVPCRPCQ